MLVTRQYGPNAKGSKISILEMDNNLLYLESLSATTEIGGTHYLFVQGNGNPTENGTELLNAYNTAIHMTPNGSALATNNRIAVVVAPGQYKFNGYFTCEASYIDIVSLTGNRDIIFISDDLSIKQNDIFINGIELPNNKITINDNLTTIKIQNCKAVANSFHATIISGTFINCIVGNNSFKGETLSGTFINCSGGTECFNANCTGTFIDCVAGNASFSSKGNPSGTFTNCVSGTSSFGSGGPSNTATYNYCIAGSDSFSGSNFKANLYYCRLTSGKFPTSGGNIHCCVNGYGRTVNTGGAAAILSESQ